MKASYHNGRATKAGNVYNANHNTKIETRDRQKHIDHEKTLENIVWARDINNLSSKKLIRQEGSFDARAYEIQFYKEKFGAARERKNAEYIRTGHRADVRTMEQVINNRKTAPLETIYQIGKEGEHVTPEQLEKVFKEFTNWMQQQYGSNMDILDVALHVDEATPHIHARYVFFARDRNGDLDVNQTAAFKELGIGPPDPQKKVGKYNNALMTFTERNREQFYLICEQQGIKINREVENPSQKHLDVLAFKTERLQQENREMEERLQQSEEKMQLLEGRAQEAEKKKEIIEETVVRLKQEGMDYQARVEEQARKTQEQAQQQAQKIEQQAQEQAQQITEAAEQLSAKKQAEAAAQAASIKKKAASEAEQMIANANETAQEARRADEEAEDMKRHALEQKADIEAQTALCKQEYEQTIAEAKQIQAQSQERVQQAKQKVQEAKEEYDRIKQQHDELEADIQDLEKYQYKPGQIARVKNDIEKMKKDAVKKGISWITGHEKVPVELETLEGMYVKSTRFENLEDFQRQLEIQERSIKQRESIVESKISEIRDRERELQLPEAEQEKRVQQRINEALELQETIYKNKAMLYERTVQERDRFRDEVNEYYAIASQLEIGQGVSLQNAIDAVKQSRTQNVVQKVLDVANSIRSGLESASYEINRLAREAINIARGIGHHIRHR